MNDALSQQIAIMKDTYANMLVDSINKEDQYYIERLLFEDFVEINPLFNDNAIVKAAYNKNNLKIVANMFSIKEVVETLKEEDRECFDKIRLYLTTHNINKF